LKQKFKILEKDNKEMKKLGNFFYVIPKPVCQFSIDKKTTMCLEMHGELE
jgi:hypothetical protein